MIQDWKQEIAVAWLVKQAIMEADKNKIWTYHLPNVAATEDQIQTAEKQLGYQLDERYRCFLKFANGWEGFVQTIDLFGTQDLILGPKKENAEFTFSYLEDAVLKKSGVKRAELLIIGATQRHSDLFAITLSHSNEPGTVIWFAGEEIQRFTNFDEFFLAMVDYNRLDLKAIKDKK
jgi:hypothetical protein